MKEFLIESEIQFERDLALFEGTTMPSHEELKEKARAILEQFEEIESLEEAAQPNPKLGAITKKIVNIYNKEYGELMALAQKAKAIGKTEVAKKFEARAEKAKKAIEVLKNSESKVGTAAKVVLLSLNLVKFSLGTVLMIAGTVFGLSVASLGLVNAVKTLQGVLTVSAWTPTALKNMAAGAGIAGKNVAGAVGSATGGIINAAKGAAVANSAAASAATKSAVAAQTSANLSAAAKTGAATIKTAFANNASVLLMASAQLIAIALILFAAIIVLKKIAMQYYSNKLSEEAAKMKAKSEVVKAINKAAAAAKSKSVKKAA
jgi:hypothetical protein